MRGRGKGGEETGGRRQGKKEENDKERQKTFLGDR